MQKKGSGGRRMYRPGREGGVVEGYKNGTVSKWDGNEQDNEDYCMFRSTISYVV